MFKSTLVACLVWGLCFNSVVLSADGVIDIASDFSVDQTANRLVSILGEKEFKIFNRIKHSEAAKAVGIDLRDTQLIIFGKPAVGSKLMRCQQSVAIDLPQKALIWQDENEQVFLSYNDPAALAKRHSLSECATIIENISKALNGISQAATH